MNSHPTHPHHPTTPLLQDGHLHLRRLLFHLDRPFAGYGTHLRGILCAHFPDRPLLHQHSSETSYTLPQIRYLVQEGLPLLVGLGQGLQELEFLYEAPLERLSDRRGTSWQVRGRELHEEIAPFGLANSLIEYRSLSPWLALNQKNYETYQRSGSFRHKQELLARIFTGNLLSLSKSIDYQVPQRILTYVACFKEVPLSHKGTSLLGLLATVTTNFWLPPSLGLGKLTAKGFGLFRQVE